METHNSTIKREGEKATLQLDFNGYILDIVLTEDKPNDVKNVFNKLLEHLKNGEFSFNLNDDKQDLYFHICKEYITQLNAELKSTYKEMQDNGLEAL